MVTAEQQPTTTSENSPMIDVVNPATQEVIGQIPVTSETAVADAVERARFAQKSWGALTVKQRLRFFRSWLDVLWDKQDEGIAVLRRENGKASGSAMAEFIGVDALGQYYIHNAPRILKPKRRPTLFPGMQSAKQYYKPHGVVGVISPWNYPMLIPFMDIIPALVAGNTVIFKPSEITPFIAQWAVELMYQVGIPRDVIQIVHGDGRTGAAVVQKVDYLHFTGSTEVGRKVGKSCAERLIPFSLELGGKDPAIVLSDADPDKTAIGLIQGAFENAGQACVSIERVYVEAPIYDRLLERLKFYAPQMKYGLDDSLDVVAGTMTNLAELERTIDHIQDAVSKGAEIVYGGKPRPDIGALVHEPTILTNVDHNMKVMQEETFGPIMPIMKVKDAEEAIRRANDNVYGLSASIWSRDFKRAEALALRLDTGDVGINRSQHMIGTPGFATGGQRESGLGRRNGAEGLLKYTASQVILTDNQRFVEDTLSIATPFANRALRILHQIRRYVPFI
jgi:succinate-semialdehyde dehydrogenase / glutarate-semialdehyde dehydrogenase